MSFEWNDAAIATLKELHAQGQSGGWIAARLGGGLSRSAVIGKIHRLGLHRVKSTIAQSMAGRRKSKATREKIPMRKAPEINFLPPEVPIPLPTPRTDLPPLVARVTFDDLEETHCRMPVGDPREPGFGFCGEPRVPGRPYCITCCQRAFRPLETRRSKPVSPSSVQLHAIPVLEPA